MNPKVVHRITQTGKPLPGHKTFRVCLHRDPFLCLVTIFSHICGSQQTELLMVSEDTLMEQCLHVDRHLDLETFVYYAFTGLDYSFALRETQPEFSVKHLYSVGCG